MAGARECTVLVSCPASTVPFEFPRCVELFFKVETSILSGAFHITWNSFLGDVDAFHKNRQVCYAPLAILTQLEEVGSDHVYVNKHVMSRTVNRIY